MRKESCDAKITKKVSTNKKDDPKKSSQNFSRNLEKYRLIRKVRTFIYGTILPKLIRFILINLIVLTLSFLGLKIFKPEYLDKIYSSTHSYFYHLLGLDEQDFTKINISGNHRITSEEVLKSVNKTRQNFSLSRDQKTLIQTIAQNIKTDLPWIQNVTITRSMPDILNIGVSEYQPFAIWQDRENKYIIDKDGNTIPYEDSVEFMQMIILSGDNANRQANSLFNIFAINPELRARIYSANWIGNRRWDVRLEDGLLVKMPENNISKAWQKLIKIYNMPGSLNGLRMIDLRIEDKIYLEYDDQMIKEMKKI